MWSAATFIVTSININVFKYTLKQKAKEKKCNICTVNRLQLVVHNSTLAHTVTNNIKPYIVLSIVDNENSSKTTANEKKEIERDRQARKANSKFRRNSRVYNTIYSLKIQYRKRLSDKLFIYGLPEIYYYYTVEETAIGIFA